MELGFMEIVVIALVIIVLFGPSKLPSIARDLGSGVRKMRGAMEDIKTEIMKEADNPISEIKREIEKVKEAAKDHNPVSQIQKEVNEMKNSVSININETEHPSENNSPKVNPADDEHYEGPISRS